MTTWSPHRTEKLIRMWGAGASAREIATELGGVTRRAIIGKAHRLKINHGGGAQGPVALVEPPDPIVPAEPVVPPSLPTADRSLICVIEGCRGTIQPGRVLCARHITKKMRDESIQRMAGEGA